MPSRDLGADRSSVGASTSSRPRLIRRLETWVRRSRSQQPDMPLSGRRALRLTTGAAYQCSSQGVRTRIPVARVLVQASQDDRLQFGGHIRADPVGRDHGLANVRRCRFRSGRPHKWRNSGQQEVCDTSDTVDVAPCIDGVIPPTCSGDMKLGVPMIPVRPNVGRSSLTAGRGCTTPKSSSFATSRTPPRSQTMMLLGLTSRWTRPLRALRTTPRRSGEGSEWSGTPALGRPV